MSKPCPPSSDTKLSEDEKEKKKSGKKSRTQLRGFEKMYHKYMRKHPILEEKEKRLNKDKIERIRQFYFRVWHYTSDARDSKWVITCQAMILEEIGMELGFRGWIQKPLDKGPPGLHGVVQATIPVYKKFHGWLDHRKENRVFDFYIHRKLGFLKDYTYEHFLYSDSPYDESRDCEENPWNLELCQLLV